MAPVAVPTKNDLQHQSQRLSHVTSQTRGIFGGKKIFSRENRYQRTESYENRVIPGSISGFGFDIAVIVNTAAGYSRDITTVR